jgi:hypothetical protein
MEPESSLPHSQVPTTCLYLESAQTSPYPHVLLLEIHLNIILPSTPGSPQWSLYLRFCYLKPVHACPLPIPATWTTHLILLDFITRKIAFSLEVKIKNRNYMCRCCTVIFWLPPITNQNTYLNSEWSPDLSDEIRKAEYNQIYVVQTKIRMREAGDFEVTCSRQCKFVIAKPEMEGMLHPCTVGGMSGRPTGRPKVQYVTINSRSFFDKILSKK